MNKSINVQTNIEKDGKNIAFMTCQIGCSLNTFNMSIQVMDEELCKINESFVNEKAKEFIRESFAEAVANGWDILKQ